MTGPAESSRGSIQVCVTAIVAGVLIGVVGGAFRWCLDQADRLRIDGCEFRALQGIQHNNLASLLELFDEGGQLFFPPVQQPYPPLYFGGSSDAGIEVAAEQVEVYLTWGEPPAAVAELIARLAA